MISKEQFVKYIGIYKRFREYLDKLDELCIKLWEVEDVAWMESSYLDLLQLLTEVPEEGFYDILEEYGFNFSNAEEIYDKLMEDK